MWPRQEAANAPSPSSGILYWKRMARAPKSSARRSASSVVPSLPADRLNLTNEERGLLADPNWVTEDDADFIIGIRRERADSKSKLHGIYFYYSLPAKDPTGSPNLCRSLEGRR